MARHKIDKAGVRNDLTPQREPYWGEPVERGLYVGFRRLEHGGNWIARYRDPNGTGGQKYSALGAVTAAFDYDEAKKAARAWRRTVDAGVKTTEVQTVADACLAYVEAIRAGKLKRKKGPARTQEQQGSVADKTMTLFRRVVLNDPLGKVKLATLRQHDLERWEDRLKSGNFTPEKVRGGKAVKALAPPAFKRVLTRLKAALNYAVTKRHVAPERAFEWKHIQPDANADGTRDLYLDLTQRRALLAAADGDLRDLLTCIAQTGCRPGDPAAMLKEDWNARQQLATFRTKTGARTIPVTSEAAALFDRLAKDKTPKARMFANGKEPWVAEEWAPLVKAAAAKAKLPARTVAYTLRHCWITDAITVGRMDLVTVARLTGTSVAMINKTYGHLAQDAAREALAGVVFA